MLILISTPDKIDNEVEILNSLFVNGLETLHLRKPTWDKQEYEDLLKAIPPSHKRKVMLHQYHELALKYNVKGLHFREENRLQTSLIELKQLRKELKHKILSFSSSFHSTEGLSDFDKVFDYVFLSPVFDSISKPEYTSSKFDIQSLKLGIDKCKIIALGGVQQENISKAMEMGFDGVALLGAVWQSENPVEAFRRLQDEYFA